MSDSVRLLLGDCLERMGEIADASVDAIVCDPPYPEIDRPYGRMTEAQWDAMMRGVVGHARRVLKPSGSAVFILQPNSRKGGSMRGWLWRFMAWACDEWNMVQDAWWWNVSAMPTGGATTHGLLRGSVKACVWLGPQDCHRSQASVLWSESLRNAERRASDRFAGRRQFPSGHSASTGIFDAAVKRGGVTPFNLLPIPNTNSTDSAGTAGHGAGTPAPLMNWWLRYICPPGGVACDPFMGSGTCGIEAIKLGLDFIGVERDSGYFATAERRIKAETEQYTLLPA